MTDSTYKPKMFFLGLCVIEQTGDDDDPDVSRKIVRCEGIHPPNLTFTKTENQLHNLLPLINAARNFNR